MRSPASRITRTLCRRYYSSVTYPPVVRISDGTFYRQQPSILAAASSDLNNPPLFKNLEFSLPSDTSNHEHPHWAIIGPSNAGKTTFLELLRGQHLCFPPTARTYPYLSTDAIAKKDPRLRYSGNAIQYVGFDNRGSRGLSGMGTYMSARYESRREATDFSVKDYLQGRIQLNAMEEEHDSHFDFDAALQRVTADLRLQQLLDMPLSNLSNGQTRRARIARALLGRPEVLLLDEPFMGLDPPTTLALADLLGKMAEKQDPRVLLALRPQDKIPEWITHIMFLGEDLRITNSGVKETVVREVIETASSSDSDPKLGSYTDFAKSLTEQGLWQYSSKQRLTFHPRPQSPELGEAVIEMDGVVVKYGEKTVLGGGRQIVHGKKNRKEGLWWKVQRGQRWGVFGPNGSGKTTLISLITSDHPQSYSLPIKLFGRSRLPSLGKPGIPLFELQRRIGHSSPEVHSFFPRHLTVRAALESAFADTPVSRPTTLTTEADNRISACLRWFQGELNPALGENKVLATEAVSATRSTKAHVRPGDPKKYAEAQKQYWYEYTEEREREVEWADHMTFESLSFSAQRVLLFLRAIVAQPDVVVLDESFSGLDETVRDKCLLFLEKGEGWMYRAIRRRKNLDNIGKYQVPDGESIPTKRSRHDMNDACFFGLTDEQALVVVSHVKEEIPKSVEDWIFLPEAGTGEQVRIGKVGWTALYADGKLWDEIWGLDRDASRPKND